MTVRRVVPRRPGWDAVSTLMALVVAGTQTAASVGVAAVVERAASVYAAKIAALPVDEEVRKQF